MMRMKTKLTWLSQKNGSSSPNGSVSSGGGGGCGESGSVNWELRPGGMLIQKRLDSGHNSAPPPTIRVRVKYGSTYHEISISSQATFGELKKMLAAPTGLHHQDQKLFFKDKERDPNAYLDIAGVKDKSKLVLMEDPISQEKRYLEMRKNAKMEKAAKSISEISLEVDRLAGQVSALESVISKGGKVAEKEVPNLIELLMNELIKLDGIVADGDVKLQRKMQVRRVQKYVETLDMLKIKNSMPTSNGGQIPTQKQQSYSNGQKSLSVRQKPPRHSVGHSPLQPQPPQPQQSRHSTSATVVTTQWETFDSAPPLIPVSSAGPLVPVSPTSTSGSAATTATAINHKFNWEFFE
ncbi:hypothetical protein Nepgr_010860 [Nepenthes gracilis]|uniref:BAG family molecular chaperone regulator 1 n=1 Tax=Nepenthes gracilis TaxID=150966 RepID=A0AAD3SD28_NEPGR|nr:hypothetical protein Nepgr_010860 [Nepenthes gracilis]